MCLGGSSSGSPTLRSRRLTPERRAGRRSGRLRHLRWIGCLLTGVLVAGCSTRSPVLVPAATPAYPEYLYPVVPDGMRGGPASLALERGWQRLQRDERTEAGREFTAALRRQADFYPARTAQGYLALAERRLDEALAAFDATLARTPAYVPALVGRGHTLLALDRVAAAADAFDAALTLAPTLDDLRRRVEVLQVRRVQAGIE